MLCALNAVSTLSAREERKKSLAAHKIIVSLGAVNMADSNANCSALSLNTYILLYAI